MRPIVLEDYPTLRASLDTVRGVARYDFVYGARPSFTMPLLLDLVRAQGDLASGRVPARFVIWGSTHPDAFGYGGDLGTFVERIRSGDLDAMRTYGKRAVDAVHGNASLFSRFDVETVSCVQGDALGGGLEAALSSTHVVAEAGGKLGFPEIGFSYFPGMGALNLVADRAGIEVARRLALDPRPRTAEEMGEMGVVDAVVPRGEGREAALAYVDSRIGEAPSDRLERRRGTGSVDYGAMLDVVLEWAATGMRLPPDALRKIDRIVAAQDRKVVRPDSAPA